ncbi:MAG: hypothetical protein ACKPKO_60835, partial [Candidatus Fonsibacter sp.]
QALQLWVLPFFFIKSSLNATFKALVSDSRSIFAQLLIFCISSICCSAIIPLVNPGSTYDITGIELGSNDSSPVVSVGSVVKPAPVVSVSIPGSSVDPSP